MTGYQFARVEGFSRSGSNQTINREKKATKRVGDTPKKPPKVATNYKKWSTREIMAEAMREPDSCRHVENPQPPSLIYGIPLAEVVAQADEWGEQAKDLLAQRSAEVGARATILEAEKAAVEVRVRAIEAREREIDDLRAHNIELMGAIDDLFRENLSLKDIENDQFRPQV